MRSTDEAGTVTQRELGVEQQLAVARSIAWRRFKDLAQVDKRVDAAGVPIQPVKAHAVSSDRLHIHQRRIRLNERLTGGEVPLAARARAPAAQVRQRIIRLQTVAPRHGQQTVRAVKLYSSRVRNRSHEQAQV